MSDSLESNRRVLRTLLRIYDQTVDLEFDLQLDGDVDTAEELAKKIKKLEKRIRKLRGQMMDDWSAQVPTLREDLQKMSRDIADAIEDIQDDINKVEQVASVLTCLDDVINLVGGAIL